MIVNMKEVLTGGTAIPQFNINNLEWAKFILEECEIKNCLGSNSYIKLYRRR